jgi:hypothetical protein
MSRVTTPTEVINAHSCPESRGRDPQNVTRRDLENISTEDLVRFLESNDPDGDYRTPTGTPMRIPADRRDARGFVVEYFQGDRFQTTRVPWSHYDLACDYLSRHGLRLNDVGEVLVNFDEAELRALLAEGAVR